MRRNFLWTLTGNLIYALANWAVLSLFARYSTPEALGEFSYALAISAPVYFLASLQLRNLQAADIDGRFLFRDLAYVRIVTTILAFCVCLGLGLAVGGQRLVWTIALVAAAKSFDAATTLLLGNYHRQKRMKIVGTLMALNGVTTMMGVWAALMASKSTSSVVGALGYMFGSLVAAVTIWSWTLAWSENRLEFAPRINHGEAFSIARTGFPLAVAGSIGSTNVAVVRHVVATSESMHVLGIFSALAYLMVPISLLANALGQVALPYLAESFKTAGSRGLTKRSAKLMVLVLGAGIGAILGSLILGDLVLKILYGAQYSGYPALLTSVMVAATFGGLASVGNYLLLAAKLHSYQLPVSVIGLLVTTVALLFLVPRFGVEGAAGSMAAGYLAHTLMIGRAMMGARTQRKSPAGAVA